MIYQTQQHPPMCGWNILLFPVVIHFITKTLYDEALPSIKAKNTLCFLITRSIERLLMLWIYAGLQSLAVAAQNVNDFLFNQLFNSGTSRRQVLSRVEVSRILSHIFTDRTGHS